MEQDWKSRASGENQRETQETGRPRLTSNGYSQEEMDNILDILISVSQTSLSAQDRIVFKQRLAQRPRWKLDKIATEFTSKWITDVWDFLDGLQSPPETHNAPKQLPEPIGKRGKLSVEAYYDLLNNKLTYPEYLERIQQIAKECE